MPSIRVLDSTIYYEDHGAGGTPVVFLHGNPSSSHTWRKVLPRIPGRRLLAPDLIGMGRSGKPEIAYTFDDHSRYLDAWFDALGLDEVILVGHDWGGALAFDWAARHPGRVRGVAFFEAIVRGMSWSQLGEAPRKRGELIRSEQGEELVLGGNFLVDTAYTGGVLTPVSEEEKAAYLAPYPTPESRRPLLRWARSIPLDGEPADVAARVDAYGEWLAGSETVPKLLLTFEASPTLMITPELAEWCGANIAALETVHVGAAGHHATEDRPAEIASEVGKWIEGL